MHIHSYKKKIQIDPVTQCHTLPLKPNSSGYISIWVNVGYRQLAHVAFYEQAHGKVPTNLEIEHTCKNRQCVNVEHLVVVTHKQNCQTRTEPDTCTQGHKFTTENTLITKEGWRRCKLCTQRRNRKTVIRVIKRGEKTGEVLDIKLP